MSKWEKEGTLEQKKAILDKIPKKCINCKSENISYWDETDEEIIFECKDCKAFLPIPYDTNKLRFYFMF